MNDTPGEPGIKQAIVIHINPFGYLASYKRCYLVTPIAMLKVTMLVTMLVVHLHLHAHEVIQRISDHSADPADHSLTRSLTHSLTHSLNERTAEYSIAILQLYVHVPVARELLQVYSGALYES